MSNKQHIVISGTPTEGFEFIGPFESFEAACEYTEYYDAPEETFCITELTQPTFE